jgi:uncharacterized protein (TIGR03435 family)
MSSRWKRFMVLVCWLFLPALASVEGKTVQSTSSAQNQDIQFEVATVKPTDPNGRGHFGPRVTADGKVTVGSASVKMLCSIAFDVDEWQIAGGPAWTGTVRYDIVGVPPASMRTASSQSHTRLTPLERQMLQSLLIERFSLTFHRVVKNGPVFLLTRGSGELKLKEPKDKDRSPAASMMVRGDTADGEVFGLNTTMANFARSLSPDLGRTVLDRTGLSGSYDFHVDPFDAPSQDIALMAIGAMQRLGLKLSAGSGPIKTVVIDGVKPPTPN